MERSVFHLYRTKKNLFVAGIFAFILLVAGCETTQLMPLIHLDTPEHHAYTGIKLIDQKKYTEAQKEFELALKLNKEYSKAYAGIALVKTYTSDFKGARDYLDKGVGYARSDEERLFSYLSMIRYQTQSQTEKNWLEEAEDAFRASVKMDPQNSSAYYFMGLAYKQACNFEAAGEMFAKVLALRGDYAAQADQESNFIRKVQRAMPVSLTGQRIALVENLTRADAAALFMKELKIDVLYENAVVKTSGAAARKTTLIRTTAQDIAGHPFQTDIERILKIGVRFLENDPDGNFKPNVVCSRAEFAMMLEDIMIRVTGDRSINKRFVGARSPFSDIQNASPYFNAAMVVTTRGLMEVKNAMTGEFAPNKSMTGVDALLSIRALKDKWNYNSLRR